MESGYSVFKKDGIEFIRSDRGRWSKVSVKNEGARHTHRVYKFPNIPADTFQSPYISWANLNCCGGWQYDENYELTAVQEGRKLCAGVVMNDENEQRAYLDNLNDEYPRFCRPPTHNGSHTFYYIDVTRKGSISDYIDMTAVRQTYASLMRDDYLRFDNFDKILEYADKPMIQLLNGSVDFDYVNPNSEEAYVITGLLLGYPLESTAAILYYS